VTSTSDLVLTIVLTVSRNKYLSCHQNQALYGLDIDTGGQTTKFEVFVS